MHRIKLPLICTLSILLIIAVIDIAIAQTYIFQIDQETVNVYWNEDGTSSLSYSFQFTNSPAASPIDFIDIGLPNENYDLSGITADVDGHAITDIQKSPYVKIGIALGLGNNQIEPGSKGIVNVSIPRIDKVVYPDSQDKNYVSADFSQAAFNSDFIRGTTNMTVIFHLPPGILPEEPRWHQAPNGFSSTPQTGIDQEGRITYTWINASADASQQYLFGASFPSKYIPDTAIVRPGFLETLGLDTGTISGLAVCCGFIAFFIIIIVVATKGSQQRKLKYLPPKIAIEGHGIKRGLTAIEAAILLEQSLDKVLTMILFSVIKKGAGKVISRDPLKIEVTDPMPTDLYPYEVKFLEAFKKTDIKEQQNALQDATIDLVKGVSQKMKGFSRRETIDYYKNIVEQAWKQVEAADTPEVKSQKFDEVMEWTMLDQSYDDRTRRVFHEGPVFVPVWWPRYDPTYRPSTTIPTATGPAPAGGAAVSLPHLPGSDFAASMVRGVQDFSASVMGNVTDFTSKVTNKTNPVPITTSSRSFRSGGGGGCACACACACAGCACACAGGGR